MVQSSPPKGFRVTAALAWCGLVGPVLFSAAAGGAGGRRPGYDPLRQTISELAERRSPDAWLIRMVYGMFDGLQIALAVALTRVLPGGRSGPLLVVVAGLGYAGAGLFPCDPGAPLPPHSPTDRLDALCTAIGLLAAATAPLAVARQLRGAAGWEPAARCSVAHGLTALGLGFVTPLCLAWRGILQHALLLATFSWLAGMAARVLRQTS